MLVQAHIRCVSTNLEPSILDVELQVNPTEINLTRGANYAEVAVPGLSMPLLQFVRGETQTLTADLFLDGSARSASAMTVQQRLEQLYRYVDINNNLHAPPVCRFMWGDLNFQGVVSSLQQKFELFDERGALMRARVSITIKSYLPVDEQARATPTQSPDRWKARVVRQGDRLDLIAAEEYGDATLWRPIAEHNGLTRPGRLPAGLVLSIPPLGSST